MSEVGEINLVLASSKNIFHKSEDRVIPEEISNLLKRNDINVSLLTSNNVSDIKKIVENKPDVVLVFENYKNIEQLRENFGLVKRLKKKIPDSKIVFFSGDQTPSGFKVGLIKRGVDAWVPFTQTKNLAEILKNLHENKKVDFKGVLTKKTISG